MPIILWNLEAFIKSDFKFSSMSYIYLRFFKLLVFAVRVHMERRGGVYGTVGVVVTQLYVISVCFLPSLYGL